MTRDEFLKAIGFPADLEIEADRLNIEAQRLWNTIKDAYFAKDGKPKKKLPVANSPESKTYDEVNRLRDNVNTLRRTAARLQRVHNDPWSHIRSEELREYGFDVEALVVDGARERLEIHGNNARFIAEAEDGGGHWVYVDKIVPKGGDRLRQGEHAVCVIVPDSRLCDIGFMAWGFSPDRAEAERLAAAEALALRAKRFPS